MTPDERGLLTHFLGNITAVRGVPKDLEADTQIRQAIDSNPDALYVLVQHAIVADQALQAAQQRINELQAQQSGYLAPQGQGSFLGGLFNHQQQSPSFSAPYFAQQPQNGMSGFLRNVGTTAAGVAAGDLLFEGIENLFGGGSRDFF